MPATHTVSVATPLATRISFSLPLTTLPVVKGTLLPTRIGYDTDFGGRGRIYGTVKVKGTPNYAVRRKVRLFVERSGICIAEQFSDPVTGEYDFKFVKMTERYTVVSYDYENNYRAVVADNLAPELIP